MRKLRKKRLNGLDKYVIFSISMLIIFTILSFYIALTKDLTLDTLTTCFFGFFGGEVVTCALIKIFKLRQNNEDISGNDDLSDF